MDGAAIVQEKLHQCIAPFIKGKLGLKIGEVVVWVPHLDQAKTNRENPAGLQSDDGRDRVIYLIFGGKSFPVSEHEQQQELVVYPKI